MSTATPAPPWRNRIVGAGEVDPATLIANPRNWRLHPEGQKDALGGALAEIGWVQQVIVNRTTGNLIDGHARIELALARSEASVPVGYVELTPDEEAVVLATLDPLGAMAETDTEKLAELLGAIHAEDPRLVQFLAGVGPRAGGGLTDPDDVPEARPLDDVWAQRGQMYALGEHRVICGDAADESVWARLMGDQRADIVWTDPPYGVGYQTNLSREDAVALHRRTDGLEVANDDLDEAGLETLLRSALGLTIRNLRPGGAVYCAAPAGALLRTFLSVLIDLGVYRQSLAWVKDAFVMGRQDFHYRHEPILYGWRPDGPHRFFGGRKLDTVWEIDRPRRSAAHPTMKPVELVARSLEVSSRPGELVVDPFAGSGTTLIAAEEKARRCYTIELDPRYAQVIIERWQEFTGRKAELLDG